MSGEITRVGIVAKSGLLAAADHLDKLASWLRARNIEPIFDTDTGKLTKATGDTRSRDARSDRRSPLTSLSVPLTTTRFPQTSGGPTWPRRWLG